MDALGYISKRQIFRAPRTPVPANTTPAFSALSANQARVRSAIQAASLPIAMARPTPHQQSTSQSRSPHGHCLYQLRPTPTLRVYHTGPRCIIDCCSCDQSVPLLRPETPLADHTSARPETPFAEYLRPATPFTDLAAEDEPNTSVGYLAPTTRKERGQGWSGTPFSGAGGCWATWRQARQLENILLMNYKLHSFAVNERLVAILTADAFPPSSKLPIKESTSQAFH
ncbi:hypothetical protein C8R47DRAFT_1235170 [Mycena vitilis]|nr:hypothetical protein C8R47DRAFT_1235170 [Mycena vitilis]